MRRALFLATAVVLSSSTTASTAHADPPKSKRDSTGDELASLYVTTSVYAGTLAVFLEAAPRADNVYASIPPIEAALVVPAFSALGAAATAVVTTMLPLKRGDAEVVSTGILLGLGEGIALNEWSSNRTTESFHTLFKDAAWVFGTASVGLVSGVVIAALTRTTTGRAGWVGTTGLFGGLLAGSIVGAVHRSWDRQGNRDVGLASAIGGVGGAALGVVTALAMSPSSLRVHIIDASWTSGMAIAALIALTSHGSKPADAFLAMSIGGTVGFTTSFLGTMGMKKGQIHDPVDSITPFATPLAGGGFQLGLGGPL